MAARISSCGGHLEKRLEAEIDRARRARASMSRIMIQIDAPSLL